MNARLASLPRAGCSRFSSSFSPSCHCHSTSIMSGVPSVRDADRSSASKKSLDEKTDEKVPVSDESASGYDLNVKSDLRELDVAVELAAGHADDPDISPEEFRRLRNKLDLHILPLLGFIYAGA